MKQNLTLFKSVVSNYNVFCSIAENIEWIKIKETHKDWFKIYPLGIFVNDYEFPKGYIQNNIVSAYVRTVLCDIAFSEKWDKDFWNIQKKERKRYLTEGILLYKSYAILKEVRFIERDWEYLACEIEYFATRNKIPVLEQKRYIDKFENAKVIEIGGWCNDFVYMAVKKDFMLIVHCGFWD